MSVDSSDAYRHDDTVTSDGTIHTGDVVSSIATLSNPERIGSYRILRRIGEGGMGSVFEAEQDNPRRTVALKVIRTALPSVTMLRRFEHEAQALGRLQHPGIAQIFEAGTAEIGTAVQPFFAMELIRGCPLGEYAERSNPDTRTRLRLIASICDAVHHAHQKGVIHRDLKPANILVDESGRSKIVDFGIARLTDADVDASVAQTDLGSLVGTIPYMSPEQIKGDASELDIRTDVYSLGVIGYELLGGQLPYDVRTRSLPEVIRVINESDPKPLGSLDRKYRGDIETIFGKALEKDKDRRYASASEFAADIRRMLSDQPISARSPTPLYQLRKFAARNRALVVGSAAVFFGMAIGLAGTGYGMVQALRAREAMRGERDLASADAKDARTVSDFIVSDVFAPGGTDRTDPPRAPMVATLDAAVVRIEREFADRPAVQAELHGRIGRAYHKLHAPEKAEINLRKAVELRRSSLAPSDERLLIDMSGLGAVLCDEGRLDEAEPLFRVVFETARASHGEWHELTVTAQSDLANILLLRGDMEVSARAYRDVVQHWQQMGGEGKPRTIRTMHKLAKALIGCGESGEAMVVLRTARDKSREVLGAEHPLTLHGTLELGNCLIETGAYPEAERMLLATYAIVSDAKSARPKLASHAARLLAELYDHSHRPTEANVWRTKFQPELKRVPANRP